VSVVAYKQVRRLLCKAIKQHKEQCWRDLCAEVEHDPWSRPYQIVTGKLEKKRSGLKTEEKTQAIVDKLFLVLAIVPQPIGTYR